MAYVCPFTCAQTLVSDRLGIDAQTSNTMDLLVSSAMEVDSSLPSFFEMFMTQQVEQSLKPAVRHAHG